VAEERQVVIETVQLTKIFRDFWMRPKVKALDTVDLQVYRGEIFGLLGPNGSGKSTLVKILLGLLFPTSGRAAMFGRDPRNIRIKDRIGYMPEESYLYRFLNAEETLNFYGRLFNLPARERQHRVQLLLDMVGLTRQRKRPIVEYSKGMARRIGLAQALINDPDIVVLDEPTTGLDPIGTREIKDLILELRERGKTVLLCSHLLADVEDVCDRVGILYGGRVRRLGNIDSLLRVGSQTQITSDQLAPETITQIRNLIGKLEGSTTQVDVEAPRDRLESFFLRVIEEARSARLETAGTTTGTGAASFFSGIEREDKAEKILSDLLKSSEVVEIVREEGRPVVVPAGPEEPSVDEVLLTSLVEASDDGSAASPKTRTPFELDDEGDKPSVVIPASRESVTGPTTQQVLDDLLGGPTSNEAKAEDENGDSARKAEAD